MSVGTEVKSNLPLIIGGVVVVALVFFIMSQGSTPAVQSNTAVTPDITPVAQADAQIAVANAQAAAAWQQTQAAEFQSVVGFATQANSNATAQAIANTQSMLQYRQAVAVANDQLQAIQAQAHTQQQDSFWNGLFGALSSVASFFTGVPSFGSGGGGGGSAASLPTIPSIPISYTPVPPAPGGGSYG